MRFCNFMFDRSTFNKNEFGNRHNCHSYSTENPHFLWQVDYYRWSINIWESIVGEYVIGLYFFERQLNGKMYICFLRNDLHDDTPAHYSAELTDHLNGEFPNEWMGPNKPLNWSGGSPDLTKLDFSYGDKWKRVF